MAQKNKTAAVAKAVNQTLTPENPGGPQRHEPILLPLNIAMNHHELLQSRTLAAVLAGIVAGILKVEGYVYGGLFFVLAMLLSSALVVLKVYVISFKVAEVFPTQSAVWFGDLSSGLLSFILCWSLTYCLVHVF